MKAPIFTSMFFCLTFLCSTSCSKHDIACGSDNVQPVPTYSYPAWHPSGKYIAFDYLPLQSAQKSGNGPCSEFSYAYYPDSSGLWVMNNDGSGKRQVTHFQVKDPCWSPSGDWLAFSVKGLLYKMPFDGYVFDTTRMVVLTTSGIGSSPSFTDTGDSLYFKGDTSARGDAAYLFKMAADGTGLTVFQDTKNIMNDPRCISSGEVLYGSYDSLTKQGQLFSFRGNMSTVRRITSTSDVYKVKNRPAYFGDYIYYEQYGLWRVKADGSNSVKLCGDSYEGYTVSSNGKIAWVNFDLQTLNKTSGTIWVMDADGSNKKQITFNNTF
ncbi:DUF5050 domain-containing protein [Deminuibacter soli]|uniref:DUF5050 domain-containing protein n=1 Tax=Deminuibacter soli TaxID=2291815 RepID=UPI001314EFAA|nr:DUF5050 domain-containing protein [Deminuibacter soli]